MKSEPKTMARRDVLRAFGAGGLAVAGSAALTDAKADTETNDEKRKSRYRETDHVKKFYAVNRYPKK
jgi:hypothetical protein